MTSRKGSASLLVRRLVAVTLPVVVWAAGANVPILRQGILFLAPFVLLLALWTAGVDPEPILSRIAGSPRRRIVRSISSPVIRAPRVLTARGGLLVAASLAGRAPPVALSGLVS